MWYNDTQRNATDEGGGLRVEIVERWGMFEVTVKGPATGNPFTEHRVEGVFSGRQETVRVEGFYDGDGDYRVRFMPSFEGDYACEVTADFLPEPVRAAFRAVAPSEGNHGPVRVANGFHFAYEDATPYYCVGTTCYVWNHQSDALIAQTLASLEAAGFNKLRFCVLPKHYDYNLHEPASYPYEGTPMDSSVLTSDNHFDYSGDCEGNRFDKTRFNPEHFRRVERCIAALQRLGVEADLIMMHPYDRWGFSTMTREEDALYWRYCVARFAAYRNVWWSLANEYDLLKAKTLADWEFYADVLVKRDPYRHLRSIHHCFHPYDYARPWVTHCSLQRPAQATDEYRGRYGKPVVLDEMTYEGDIPWLWGNITGEEMTRRFWEVAVRGGYPGHGETYLGHEADMNGRRSSVLWWSHGGRLYGESWKRVKFLRDILAQTPGHGLKPVHDMFGVLTAAPESELSEVKSYYLIYYGIMQPREALVEVDRDTDFRVERIDTWNMTVEDAGVHRGRMRIPMPGRQYMALRLRRVDPKAQR